MSKHTKGPWEVRMRFGRMTTVSGPQRYAICDTGTAPLGTANHRREEANARLIAAAPDMYEVLKRLVIQMNNLLMVCDVPARFASDFNSAQHQAEAALAKAEGLSTTQGED